MSDSDSSPSKIRPYGTPKSDRSFGAPQATPPPTPPKSSAQLRKPPSGQPDIRRLQEEVVRGHSHAADVVKLMIRIPEAASATTGLDDTTDTHVLRSVIHELRASIKSLAASAEIACQEVERRCMADSAQRVVTRSSSPDEPNPSKNMPSRVDATVDRKNSPGLAKHKASIFKPSNSNHSPLVPLLDAISDLISAEAEHEGWDLLKEDHRPGGTHTTVGIRIAHGSHARDLRPCQIQLIIPGTSAHLCGLLQRGDEIVSVDGKPVDETNIVAAVRGTDIVGSHVKLRVQKRDGRMVEANLVRGAWGAVERKERVFICFESLTRALDKFLLSAEYPSHHAGRDSLLHSPRFPQRGVDSKPSPRRLDKHGGDGAAAGGGASEPSFEWVPEILGLVDRCIETAMENERHRTSSEVRVHDRLQVLQREMLRLLAQARQLALTQEASLIAAQSALSEQLSELSIPLHEQVEGYVRSLQDRVEEAEVAREQAYRAVEEATTARTEAQSQSIVLHKFMDRVRKAKNLAGFTRQKISDAYSNERLHESGSNYLKRSEREEMDSEKISEKRGGEEVREGVGAEASPVVMHLYC